MSLSKILMNARATFVNLKDKSTKQESIDKLTNNIEMIDSYLEGGIDIILTIVNGYEEKLIVTQGKLRDLVGRNLASSSNLDIREKELIKAESYILFLDLVDVQTNVWQQLEKLRIIIEKQMIPKKVEVIAAKVSVTPTAAKKQFDQTEESQVLNEHLIYVESIYKTAESLSKVADQFSRGTMQSVSVLNKEVLNK